MMGRLGLMGLMAVLVWPVFGVTLAERIAELTNDPDVLAAAQVEEAIVPLGFGSLNTVHVRYISVAGDVAEDNTAQLIGNGDETGDWYWLVRVPAVLTNGSPLFITDRTGGGFTEAQVKSTVQAVWADAVPTANPIIDLQVSVVDGKTIRAVGLFDAGNGQREQRSYLLWLEDVNGSVTPGNANIKWELETGS